MRGGGVERLVLISQAIHVKLVIDPEHVVARLLSLLAFAVILILLMNEPAVAYTDDKFKTVCQSAMDYLEGGFGALLTAVAGTGAIVASALGGFKTAWSLLVVAIGSFILRNFIIGQDAVGLGLFNAGAC